MLRVTPVECPQNPMPTARQNLEVNPLRGLKKPPTGLDEWIRLANLTRPGSPGSKVLDNFKDIGAARETVQNIVDETGLPEEQARQIVASKFGVSEQDLIGQWWPFVLEWVDRLDDPLRSELIAKGDLYADWTTGPHSAIRASMVLSHAEKIIVARDTLHSLSKPDSEPANSALEALLNTLRHEDLRYLRTCGICNNIFWAGKSGKSTQRGCTPKHSAALRSRDKRKRDKLAKQTRKEREKQARIARKELAAGKTRAKKRATKEESK